MSKNVGWVGRLTAAVSATFLMACGSAPQKEELPGVLISRANVPVLPETDHPDPLNPTVCRNDFPDVLTHKDMHPILMGGKIVLDSRASPEDIQAAAKKQFDERSALFQKIFGCDTPQAAEMNLLAQRLSIHLHDAEAFTKIQNLVVVNNYADVANYYSPEYFKKMTRAQMAQSLRPFAKSIQELGLSLEIEKVEEQLNDVVQSNYINMVSMALRADLARLFGRKTPDDAVVFAKYIEKEISGVISEEIARQPHSQSDKPQVMPYYEEEKQNSASVLSII